MGLHPAALIALYGAVALAPLALCALTSPRENDFLAELGVGLGLVAYAMGRAAECSGRCLTNGVPRATLGAPLSPVGQCP